MQGERTPVLEMATGFTRAEKGLVGSAAALVFTRVFAVTLTFIGFTEFAGALRGAADSGHQDLLAGLAFGLYGLTMAVAQIATGALSDRIGRKPVLLAGTAAFVLGALLCYWSQDIWTLMAGRLLQGLGGVSSVALAAVGETVPAERRTTAMAFVGIPAGAGAFLGILLGPALAGLVGFRGLFVLTAVLGVLASAYFLARPLPAPLPGLATPRRSWSLPVLGLGAVGLTVNFALGAIFVRYQSDVQPHFGELWLGATFAVALAGLAAVTRAIDRRGATWLPIAIGLAALAVAAPLFRLGGGFALTFVAGCVLFLAHAVLSAVLPSQVSRLAGRSGGLGHGIQLVFAYLGSFLGPVVAGALAEQGQYGMTFEVLAVAAAAAAMLAYAGLRRLPSRDTPAPIQEAAAP